MAINYAQILSADTIAAEIEALVDWHVQLTRYFFYPASRKAEPEIKPPSSLLQLYQKHADKGRLDKKNLPNLTNVYDGLHESALKCVTATSPLTLEQFDSLAHHLEAYLTHLRRLQRDLADASMSVDSATGLRTVAGMRIDLKREQDRFNRKGTPFCIANVEIDRLADLQKKYDSRTMDILYGHLARSIVKTVRSFDDIYYMGKGEYIVVLKHVGFVDACAVIDRLRLHVEATPLILENGEKVSLSASFGIAQSMQNETYETLLKYANDALHEAKKMGGGRVQEYKERSAFDTFVQAAKDQ